MVSELSRGGFKKAIMGRYFYWPASLSRSEAERQAAVLVLTGRRLRAAGLPWDERTVDDALALGGGMPTNRAKANERRDAARLADERRARAERERRERDTLHGGLDDYLRNLGTRDVSQAYKARGRAAVALVKRLGADVRLSDFDLGRLGEVVDALNADDYAHATIRTTLHFLSGALDYLDTRGRWELSRRAVKLLKPSRCRTAPVVETFTVSELKRLHDAASPLVRACLLLALNCGFTTAELTTLASDHVRVVGDAVQVVKARTKTGVRGCWTLWPETVAAIGAVKHPQGRGRGGLLLTTARGTPLCHVTAKGERSDALVLAWRRLCRRKHEDGADVLPVGRRLPFKCLRKTGATMVRDAAGLDAAQRYLAHVGATVAERHYVGERDDDGLGDVLSQVRERLALLFTVDGTVEKIRETRAA